MGYRSQVAFAITKEKYLEHKIILQDSLFLLDEADEKYSDESAHYFLWDTIKWYESDDDIAEIESLMGKLDQLDTDGDYTPYYAFIRIGEDFDDITERGQPYEFNMQLERDITLPTSSPFTG